MSATLISGYTVHSEVHRGRKSVILRARRVSDGRAVMLKTLRREHVLPDDAARFRHEYEIVSSLADVEGVVRPYGFERYDGEFVMVMEDFGGESLRSVFKKRPLAIREFLDIAIPIAATLREIHNRDIVHKDINPNNILLNREDGRVKLTDFGLASRLSRENQSAVSPHLLEGTLAYMSPEQTGRMNRVIDYRTDFYSLGVTFYELLTGQLPFVTTDPVELVHHHIAKQPSRPDELRAEVPQAVSAIVMKLLAKTAEDRYQSARGLCSDLEECKARLRHDGSIPEFELGHADVTDRFRIPQKLYGRADEIAALLDGFDRVMEGQTEIILVGGYAGIGKSSLIQEIHKPVVRQKAFFVSGKCDQYHGNIPYASVIQAFRQLIRQVLTESEERIAVWRTRLTDVLGSNGQILVDVIPEVELIIGKQPPTPHLGPIEAQNRFNLVVQHFVGVFARADHPLVVFLDDLQWADTSSLKLVELLATDPDRRFLCIVGAYRANEVSESHPLALTVSKVKDAGVTVTQLMLQGLELADVTQLICDALACDADRAGPLAQVALERTEGNPFFLNQFLTALYAEGLLQFSGRAGRWEWDLEQIRARGITDNVVELMVGKIQKLSPRTQQILRLASCIGSRFDLKTLSIVMQETQKQIASELWEAIREDLILPVGDDYRLINTAETEIDRAVAYEFLHDRVQQAAYSLIPETERRDIRFQVGRLLLKETAPAQLEERIFEIVNQLNFGAQIITAPNERYPLATLNLSAGRKAKGSLAYDSAAKYLSVGIQVLPDASWVEHYQLSFDLHLEYATALALSGDLPSAERHFTTVFERAKTDYERGTCCDIQAEVLQCAGKAADAFLVANRGLALFGRGLPSDPEEAKRETARLTSALLKTEAIERLEGMPEATAAETLLISRLYDRAIISSYFSQPQNLGLVISESVDFILARGLTPTSGTAISWFAMIAAMQGHMALALNYATLAVRFVDRFRDPYVKGRVDVLGYAMCLGWKYPFRTSEQSLHETYLLCHSSGDLQYASYALISKYIAALLQAQDCRVILDHCQQWRDYCQRYVPLELGHARIRVHLLEQLMDIEHDELDPLAIIAEYEAAKNFTDVCEPLMELARVGTLFGDYAGSYAHCQRAEPLTVAGAAGNLLLIAGFYHIYGICAARLYAAESDPNQKQQYLDQLDSCLTKLRSWAELTPDNFRSYCTLVEAERARALSDTDSATASYLATIRHARAGGFNLLRAMAHEFLAELYAGEGFGFARAHVNEAYALYIGCGAHGKARQLVSRALVSTEGERAAGLTSPGISQTQESVSGVSSEILDLATVIKAAQTIASEIVLERLLEKMLRTALENAAAQSGYLILQEATERLVLEAEAHVDRGVTVLRSVPFDSVNSLPATIVRYVARTCEPVVLGDAAQDGLFTQDPYIVRNQTKSVLCMPLLQQGGLVGLLYLENNLTSGAFTPERLRVLHILASQAAIAIENARLYSRVQEHSRELENRVAERTRALQKTNRELVAARAVADAANEAKSRFLASMSHELRTPLNAIIGYSEMLQDEVAELGSDELTSDLQKITVAGRHLLELINAVLDLSKIEAGKMELHLEEFSLRELARDVEAVIQPLAERNGNRLEVQCLDSGRMRGDLTKVRQSLLNLLSNSCKFTDHGVVRLVVVRERKEDNEYVIFTVQDSGIGMTPEQTSQLFQEFTQVGIDTGRTYGGTGLGLALSRRLCRMMSGDITVTSELGRGSTFTIRLPAEVQAMDSDTSAAPNVAEGVIGEGETVLVIDDEPTVRDLMQRFLVKEGFRVVLAATGQDGLRLAKDMRPDVITLDVLMPGMDGWSVLTALKTDPECGDIPVIMLTIVDDKHLGYALGAADYLIKPIDRDRLIRVLRKYRRDLPVLIVDDDADFRELLTRLLTGAGFTVIEAEDGRAAFARLEDTSPGTILLDLMMPGMDGFEFVAALRTEPRWHDIPVLVITARDLTPEDRQHLNGRVERVLAKGAYSGDALLQEVRGLVQSCIGSRRRAR